MSHIRPARRACPGFLFAVAMAAALATARAGDPSPKVSLDVLAQGQAAPAGDAKPGEAIEAGREVFEQGGYPWYDDESDSLKRVPVSRPFQWPDWSPNFNLGAPSWLGWIPWITIIIVLLVIAYLLIRVYLNRELMPASGGTQAATAGQDDVARVEALPFPVKRRTVDLLEEARRCYQQGNFSEAVIYFYSHLLVELDRNHLIRLTQGKTNRQYLGEVAVRPTLHGPLEQTMVAFEDVFFGGHAMPRARFESCFSRLDEFKKQLSGIHA